MKLCPSYLTCFGLMCAGRPGSDDGEWTEHWLKTRPATSHARAAGGATEGEERDGGSIILVQLSESIL